MTRKLSTLITPVLALVPALAFAVPQSVGFSARIADNGRPVTGTYEFVFRFWDCDGTDTTTCIPDPVGTPSANVLWRETQTLQVTDGVVTAALGADVANLFPATLFDGSNRWLSVTMGGTDFGPFLAVRSTPYAIAAGSVPWSGISGMPAGLSDGATLSCTTVTGSLAAPGPGSYSPSPSPVCPSGYIVTGAGHYLSGDSGITWALTCDHPSGSTGWHYVIQTSTTVTYRTLNYYLICCRVQ